MMGYLLQVTLTLKRLYLILSESNKNKKPRPLVYIELIFVDSKSLKQAYSKLQNCSNNEVYRQKYTDRNRIRDRVKYNVDL